MLFKKTDEGRVQIDTDEEVMRNWRIDQVLMSKYFDLPSSRPASLDGFMQRRKSVISGEKENCACNSLNNDIDEYGYLPTGETLSDVKAMVYIHQMAEKLKKEGHL